MRQAFPVGVLNDISSLFDGSNKIRGQMDAANAGKAAEEMRKLKRQNDMLDYNNLAQTSALFAGLDQNKAEQYRDFQNGGGLALSQKVGADGVNMPAGMATAAAQAMPDFFDEATQQKIARGMMQASSGAAFGGDMRDFGTNQIAYEKRDEESAMRRDALNAGSVDGANMIISALAGKQYTPYATNSNGVVINKATGAVDTSNPLAGSVIALNQSRGVAENALGGLRNEQSKNEVVQRGLISANTNKALASISDLDAQTMELYKTPVIDADGSQKIGMDGKPVYDIDRARLSADINFANKNGVSVAQAYARGAGAGVGGGYNAGNSLGALFGGANTGGLVKTGMNVANIIQSGAVKSPADIGRLLSAGKINEVEASAIAQYYKSQGK